MGFDWSLKDIGLGRDVGTNKPDTVFVVEHVHVEVVRLDCEVAREGHMLPVSCGIQYPPMFWR